MYPPPVMGGGDDRAPPLQGARTLLRSVRSQMAGQHHRRILGGAPALTGEAMSPYARQVLSGRAACA